MVDLNMADLYSLGLTPVGKRVGLIPRLFEHEEIQLLESLSNEEQLHDLEESIMMNSSSIVGPGGNNRRAPPAFLNNH